MPGWEDMPPLASPCTSSPWTIHGSLEWGRSVVPTGDISRSRAKYRPLHAACPEIPNRHAHPLPAPLLSGMAVAHLRRQNFWCRRDARGTLPGSRARVVGLPMLPDHRADDPGWDSGLLTFLTIASGDPKTWATNPQIPKSSRVRISWLFVTVDDGGSRAPIRLLGIPDHRVGLKTEEGHDATSNARDHHHAGALAAARRGDGGFATRTVRPRAAQRVGTH